RRMLLRKMQAEGRDIAVLLDNQNVDAVVDTLPKAQQKEMPRSTKDYIVLPGTLITQEEP
ncbi:MAG: hypothetical protein VYB08_02420, partial [Candidatus Latescibacterota bacterium]|nr:hypothetical protein [Candidatus Latescibacterota bacterium]